MKQCGGPDDEHRMDLPCRAVVHRHWQESVCPQEGRHPERHACDESDVQTLDEAKTKMRSGRIRYLGAPLDSPQHEPRRDHGGASNTEKEIKPAHFQRRKAASVHSDHPTTCKYPGTFRLRSSEDGTRRAIHLHGDLVRTDPV